MAWLEHIRETGIYQNEATQCWEAWVVVPVEGSKRLVSTCSVEAPESAYQWWLQHVCGEVMKVWGHAIPAAA